MLHDDGTLYAGDSVGVRIAPASFVLAPDPAARYRSRGVGGDDRETERRAPARLALTHFGVFEDVSEHLGRAPARRCSSWGDRVAHGMDEATFVAAARADCRASDPERGRRLRSLGPVLPVLPRARALLAQTARGGPRRAGARLRASSLYRSQRWIVRHGCHWRRTGASTPQRSSSEA